jgi:hypothetical protein
MLKISEYYKDVMNGRYEELLKRHKQFPELVMTCAISDYKYDVVSELLNQKVKVNYNPMFKFKWVEDKSTLLGISPQNLETPEELDKKFGMINFLLEHNTVDEKIIPQYLIPNWREYKGIKIGSRGNAFIYFILVMISIIMSLCLSVAF